MGLLVPFWHCFRVRRKIERLNMPWQVQLKRKSGVIRAQLPGSGTVPEVGDEISLLPEEGRIRAKVTEVQRTTIGESIGQPVVVVVAEEI